MIEVRRDLYMDEATGERRPAFAGVRSGPAVMIEAAAAADAQHALLSAYRATRYVAGEGDAAIVLRIGERNDSLVRVMAKAHVGSAAFITAWNPFSETRPVAENEAAQRALVADVEAGGWLALKGYGQGDDATWPAEPSLLVLGLNEAAARALMVRYRQNAVVWGGPDGVPDLSLNERFAATPL